MKKIKENKGRISTIELVTLLFLGAFLLFLGIKGLNWYYSAMKNGNDGLMVNTAESVAIVNSLNGMQCPVNDCGHGENCPHRRGEYYVGYFDAVGNKIVEYPPKGYNQAKVMHVDDKKYYGDEGTMVIEVLCKDGVIELNWVKSK